ncbi:hypothetical protein MDA_GLEAN10021450 [Myotis davidii]|uniref:Uncharacterized protein n=1 Tax=Myotis davidii TaxID=225400 RepID=L5LSA5_MYODS|nr:hypothetical protein MDA_GLEAN10021450 [Myotis davidii]
MSGLESTAPSQRGPSRWRRPLVFRNRGQLVIEEEGGRNPHGVAQWFSVDMNEEVTVRIPAGPCSKPVVTDLAEQPLSCGRASSQAPLGAALPAGFQKLRGQDIFSIQTIRFLRPLIAQVGEGKGRPDLTGAVLTSPGLFRPHQGRSDLTGAVSASRGPSRPHRGRPDLTRAVSTP